MSKISEKKPPVICIDGPSASGKGEISRRIAKNLGYHLLDSGMLYRILALEVERREVDLLDKKALTDFVMKLNIEFVERNGRANAINVNGKDVSLDIRTDKVSKYSSKIAAIPAVREALLKRQIVFRKPPGLVADGRDMGSVVFPDAEIKIFLTASPAARAERRYKQLIGKGIRVKLSSVLDELIERDARDQNRAISPLVISETSIVIDSTQLSVEQVSMEVMNVIISKKITHGMVGQSIT